MNNPQPQSDRDHWIGFDLGGTKMLATVFDADMKIVGKARKKSKGHEGAKAGLERISSTIREAVGKAGLEPERIAGIGIGCPGPLDLQQGVIHEAPNLGWNNVPVKKHLESDFSCPAIVANDVDAGVFGEYTFGAGKGARCVVGIFPGTGIGGGCVYDGKIFHGANCTCMEIGHIPMMANGPLDGCSNPGSLESLASRLAIAGAAAQAAYRGQAPSLLKNSGTDISNIRSGAIASAVQQDDAVREIVVHAANQIGLAVVTLVHLLAPDVVVLGGGLVEAMPGHFSKSIEDAARARVLPSYNSVFKIAEAELGDNATAMGAAAWAKTTVDQPKMP